MKIAYGIHGYGRGHAGRALAILPELSLDSEILLLAGGDAYRLLREKYQVTKIPYLTYIHGAGHRHYSVLRTMWANFGLLKNIFLGGRYYREVRKALQGFKPDIVVSDSEPLTRRAARKLGIPLVSFDHYGVLAYCKWKMPLSYRLRKWATCLIYQLLMGKADRIIACAFYPATPKNKRVHVVGPILREAVKKAKPETGEHLLFYLGGDATRFTDELQSVLSGVDVEIRAFGLGERENYKNIRFFKTDPDRFVEELASCKAVVASAGNQLTGECIYLGKPVLLFPENAIEQKLNALGVVQMGVGMRTTLETISPELLREFLGNCDTFRKAAAQHARDSAPEVVELITNISD